MAEQTMQIQLGNETRNVYVEKKRNNRNMYLRIKEDGSLYITCPYGISQNDILNFIHEKENWIAKATKKQSQQSSHIQTGSNGKTACWLGKTYPVEFHIGSFSSMIIKEDKILYLLKKPAVDEIDRTFYRFAVGKLMELVDERRGEWDEKICRANGIPCPVIKYRYMTSEWGNCKPAKHEIVLSKRLIHFPVQGLEYVLLHEYVHFLVPNHSKKFYDIVAKYMPAYRAYNAVLK